MENGALDPLRATSAIFRTLLYLYMHGLIILVLSILLTLLAAFKSSEAERGDSLRQWAASKFTSNLAFGTLGFALAYLLSQGVNSNGPINSELQLIVTPLIPLITGGVLYVESNGTAPTGQPRTGIINFLMCFVLCYQTFYYQITFHWPGKT